MIKGIHKDSTGIKKNKGGFYMDLRDKRKILEGYISIQEDFRGI